MPLFPKIQMQEEPIASHLIKFFLQQSQSFSWAYFFILLSFLKAWILKYIWCSKDLFERTYTRAQGKVATHMGIKRKFPCEDGKYQFHNERIASETVGAPALSCPASPGSFAPLHLSFCSLPFLLTSFSCPPRCNEIHRHEPQPLVEQTYVMRCPSYYTYLSLACFPQQCQVVVRDANHPAMLHEELLPSSPCALPRTAPVQDRCQHLETLPIHKQLII